MKVADHNEAVQESLLNQSPKSLGSWFSATRKQTDSYQNLPIRMTQFTSKS